MRRSGEIAIALALTVAAFAAGSALYSERRPAAPVRVAQPEWVAMQTEPAGEPIRVANPFDASEVFEFPAGTSEADAQEAVAGFLIERASNRAVSGTRRRGS
jgi:hypothetical protein